jgi:AraC family transcriptional regulator of adaptative response/methylated-DNA-[protein]-cysteine methyltransferase
MSKLKFEKEISYGFSTSPFGECCIAVTNEGIVALSFPENRDEGFLYLQENFPHSELKQDNEKAAGWANQIFTNGEIPKLKYYGTDFQKDVWTALQEIPAGETTTYAQIAQKIGRPKAVRAVGTAIGANPIAFLIPCHRVIRTDGGLGGFRWGLDRKKKILEWEKK